MKPISNSASTTSYIAMFFLCFLCSGTFLHAQWKQCNGLFGGMVVSLAAMDSSIFAGVYHNGVFRSDNNGESWYMVNNGLTDSFVHAVVVKEQTLFVGTGGGSGIYKSLNKGNNWMEAKNGLAVQSVFSLALSGSTIYAGTLEGSCFQSTDDGNNWAFLHNGLFSGVAFGELSGSDTTLYIRMKEGGIVRVTEHTGIKYLNDVPFFNQGVLSIAGHGETVFVSTQSNNIFRSINKGESWESVNTGLSQIAFYRLAVSPLGVFAAPYKNDNGYNDIYRSLDNGNQWHAMQCPKKDVRIVTLFVRNTTVYVSFEDSTLWKYENASSVAEGAQIDGAYITPNPVSNFFTISGLEGISTVNLVNGMGVNVTQRHIVGGKLTMDVSDIANGIYFVQFHTKSRIISKPIMVIH